MTKATCLILLSGAIANAALAQADFTESFDNNGTAGASGPSNLVARGFTFRNQSNPVNSSAWYDGDGFGGLPFAGSGYLSSSSLATDFLGGALSTWMILPELPGQSAGDTFSLWIYGGGAFSSSTYLDVRYAPSGSGTGSGPDDVGDFTELLYSAELPLAAQNYQLIEAALPGAGRIAVRFHSPFVMTFAGRGATLSIDELTVGPPPGDPCGTRLPADGQTLVWSLADSPIAICQDLLIPSGARVEIEPGVEVHFEPDATLRVEGELVAIGTPTSTIRFTGSQGLLDGLEVAGEAELAYAEVTSRISGVGEDAVLLVADSLFSEGATASGAVGLAVVERCTFDGTIGDPVSLTGSVRVSDCQFINGAAPRFTGVLRLQGVHTVGTPLVLQGEAISHPVLVEHVSATNVINGPGIDITGPNYLIGSGVVTQNNLYPLLISGLGGGVLPGSDLPQTGNAINKIAVDELHLGADRHWANTGLTYSVLGGFPALYGGTLRIDPGNEIEFGPGAGAFLVQASRLVLGGTSEEPITIRSQLGGASRWFGLKWVDNFDAWAQHTVFDGGEIAVQSDGGYLDLLHCTVQNSVIGTASVTGGSVRLWNSRILNNAVGMTTTSSGRIEADGTFSPSIFEGNGVAIEYLNTNGVTPFLRYNWWGAPSGPTSPLNPGGTGDVVQNVHPSAFTPFLAAAPSQDDEFPVVRMMPTYFMAHTGDKIILRWESTDDDAVLEHRVEWADVDFPDDYEVVATLPGDASTYELTIPTVEPTNRYTQPSAIRVVAVDSAGQEWWDKSVLRVPYVDDITVTPQLVSTPIPPIHPRDTIDVCWSPGGTASVYVLLDGIAQTKSAGGSGSCLPIGVRLPASSTDTARLLVLITHGAGGRLSYHFSEPFEIRPDPRFGDAPPTIDITGPVAGQAFAGGAVVPVSWTAGDDEALRSFAIQASYDGGDGWHFVARDLPADARAFDWRLPPSTGIDDVQIRVVAFDHRFQESSDTLATIDILPGDTGACPADLTGEGQVNTNDFFLFLGLYQAQDPRADFAPGGGINTNDFFAFLAAYQQGC